MNHIVYTRSKMKYYPIEHHYSLTEEDIEEMGVELKDVTLWSKKVFSLSHDGDVNIMAKKKIHPDHFFDSDMNNDPCVFRAPLKDEWFLSGAFPAAYRAERDLSISYYIVELVLVKTITITSQVEVTL